MNSLEEVTSLFHQQLRLDKLHHAWLVEGGDAETNLALGEQIVAALLGIKPAETHFDPNLFWLDVGDSHAVDSVRGLIRFLEKSSWNGSWKVAIIQGANQLNSQGQNALLKVLEEPSDKTVIFLISEISAQLLPTLYSRGLLCVFGKTKNSSDEFLRFEKEWKKSIQAGVLDDNYEPLFELQERVEKEEVSIEQQIQWALQVIRNMMDLSNPIFPVEQLLESWGSLQLYYANVQNFKLETKRLLCKMTAVAFFRKR